MYPRFKIRKGNYSAVPILTLLTSLILEPTFELAVGFLSH